MFERSSSLASGVTRRDTPDSQRPSSDEGEAFPKGPIWVLSSFPRTSDRRHVRKELRSTMSRR